MMKRLMIVLVVASLAWFAYWFIGAARAKSGFEDWFAARQAEGWQAETSEIAVRGFPNRFDATFSDLALADPETGVAWQAPFFQLFALTYRPHHLIAVWPNEQLLAFPDQRVTVTTTDMKASLVVDPAPQLPLERTNLAVEGLTLASTANWALNADALRLAMHREPDNDKAYRIALSAEGLAPPLTRNLPNGGTLPETLKTVEADLTAGFEKPWDIRALNDARPQPTWINLAKAEIIWGQLELHAAGKVDIDSAGYPNGTITIRATNWRDILGLARQTGELPEALLDGIEQGLELLSSLTGRSETLDIPLTFRSGMTRLGPVPIAPAPRILLR